SASCDRAQVAVAVAQCEIRSQSAHPINRLSGRSRRRHSWLRTRSRTMSDPKADPRLILPLDLPTRAEAEAMVQALGDAVSFYKVGLQLLATEGMALA